MRSVISSSAKSSDDQPLDECREGLHLSASQKNAAGRHTCKTIKLYQCSDCSGDSVFAFFCLPQFIEHAYTVILVDTFA